MIEKRRQKQLAELLARIGRLRGQVLYLQQEEHLGARVLQTVARRWLVWDSVIKGAAARVLQRAVRRFLGRHRPGRQTGYQLSPVPESPARSPTFDSPLVIDLTVDSE